MIILLLKDKRPFFLVSLITAVACATVLYVLACPIQLVFLISFLYLAGTLFAITAECLKKTIYYTTFSKTLEQLESKQLICEVMEEPDFYEGEIWVQALRAASKSMNDTLAKNIIEHEEYREYIELWVHEIKTPISATKLICENNEYDNAAFSDVLFELSNIEKQVERALFYARSSAVEKDYVIKEIHIKELIHSVIRKNAKFLIAGKIRIDSSDILSESMVYSDGKWMAFILQQLLDNSVKYGAKTVEYCFSDHTLEISDDGIGISEGDLSRVFERGFTGKNGRTDTAAATGMGLYLVKKLCDKMGLGIELVSNQGAEQGTTVRIVFPKNSFLSFT
ncbi:sensor histidine kinase [Clostridia bacterium]|nr:sensor histidine kinase [Clostridia bacterium]